MIQQERSFYTGDDPQPVAARLRCWCNLWKGRRFAFHAHGERAGPWRSPRACRSCGGGAAPPSRGEGPSACARFEIAGAAQRCVARGSSPSNACTYAA